jgi:hypothetical protein
MKVEGLVDPTPHRSVRGENFKHERKMRILVRHDKQLV